VLTAEQNKEALEEHVGSVADPLLSGEEPGHHFVEEEQR
jgi:hypothetical protein